VKTTEIFLIEKKDDEGKKTYQITVNGENAYYAPFTDETKAKAATLDEILLAQKDSRVYVAWHSIKV
jgi:hypothetical protein